MHRVTWKTYGDNENYREFSEYAAAKKFFWFLQKQSWARCPELQSTITDGSFSLAEW